MFISKETYNVLNLELIWDKIKPLSVFGRNFKKDVKPYTKSMENDAYLEFSLMNQLMIALKNFPQFYNDVSLIFSHLEDISLILQNLDKNKILEIFELQEIKNFIFFYQRFEELIENKDFENKFFFPNLLEIFNLLDPEKQNTPVFFISNKYDIRINSRKKVEMLDWKLNKKL